MAGPANGMAMSAQIGGATHLECTKCAATFASEQTWRLSPCCEKPLYPRYDLRALAATFRPESMAGRDPTIWRYAEVLPVRDARYRLTLGEGMTPLLDAPRLAGGLGQQRVWLKDEGQNPTASFKARGLAMAVARAWELGVEGEGIIGARRLRRPGHGGDGTAPGRLVPDIPRAIIARNRLARRT